VSTAPAPPTPFATIAELSEALAQTSARGAKVATIAGLLQRVAPAEVPAVVGFLSGKPRFGKIGIGYATLGRLLARSPAADASLGVGAVESELLRVDGLDARDAERALGDLFATLTATERTFLARVLGEGLRQGSLAGVMLAAIAKAFGAPEATVRRATMMSGDMTVVAAALAEDPHLPEELLTLTPGRPILPMLAEAAKDTDAALSEASGSARIDVKMDGVRVQIHSANGAIRIFSRSLGDLTSSLGPIVATVEGFLAGRGAVLDGEVLLVGPSGRPRPFQDTMSALSEAGREGFARRAEGALALHVFDVLHDGTRSLVDAPLSERHIALTELVPEAHRIPCTTVGSAEEARAFYEAALRDGHEGVVVKRLDAPYVAGARDAAWYKVKKVETVDLVVLAAEWGHGRRQGWLSNLHLGARAEGGAFVMVGKTFKGMTDTMLAAQTERLLALESSREGDTQGGIVFVRPEMVVEVAFNDVQRSARYPGGVALRLARVLRHRDEKPAHEVDTLARLTALAPPPHADSPEPQRPAPREKTGRRVDASQLALFGDLGPSKRRLGR